MVEKIHAHAGKILRVNLSNGKITTEPTMRYAKNFLGGRGINQWILYKEVKPGIWPFDPANRLIFGTGVFVGTPAPTAGRLSIDSKNVYTGGIGSANSGGHFGPELKFAGYDNLVVQGRSRNPCYLWIDDDEIEVKNAEHIWGKTTWATDDLIREELGDDDIQIADIGPAGENLVRAACIVSNGARVAGRCGLGSIMGSKNLKAIAVKGTGEITVANPEKFMQLVDEFRERILSNNGMKRLMQWGTNYILEISDLSSGNPVRNFQDGYWDSKKVQKLSTGALEKYIVRRLACFACPVHCSRYLKISNGPFKGTEGEGIECTTSKDFGCKLDIDNLPAVIKAHILCNQYGLDLSNTAGVIAWAMECYEKGILKKEDLDGLELDWGNYEAVFELMKKITFREGIGDLLAEGSKRASEILGKGEKYSITIKGQELYEVLRRQKGWALGVVLSSVGGGHLRGAPQTESLRISSKEGKKFFGVSTAGDRTTYSGKAKLVIYFENLKAIADSLNLCYFATQYLSPYLPSPKDLAKLFSAATGKMMTGRELMLIGERIHNVEKAFNVREGISRKDDMPPERFFEPIKSGPGKGERLEKEKWTKTLDEYYKLRGWNVKTGLPKRSKLEGLKLGYVAKELEKLGKLA